MCILVLLLVSLCCQGKYACSGNLNSCPSVSSRLYLSTSVLLSVFLSVLFNVTVASPNYIGSTTLELNESPVISLMDDDIDYSSFILWTTELTDIISSTKVNTMILSSHSIKDSVVVQSSLIIPSTSSSPPSARVSVNITISSTLPVKPTPSFIPSSSLLKPTFSNSMNETSVPLTSIIASSSFFSSLISASIHSSSPSTVMTYIPTKEPLTGIASSTFSILPTVTNTGSESLSMVNPAFSTSSLELSVLVLTSASSFTTYVTTKSTLKSTVNQKTTNIFSSKSSLGISNNTAVSVTSSNTPSILSMSASTFTTYTATKSTSDSTDNRKTKDIFSSKSSLKISNSTQTAVTVTSSVGMFTSSAGMVTSNNASFMLSMSPDISTTYVSLKTTKAIITSSAVTITSSTVMVNNTSSMSESKFTTIHVSQKTMKPIDTFSSKRTPVSSSTSSTTVMVSSSISSFVPSASSESYATIRIRIKIPNTNISSNLNEQREIGMDIRHQFADALNVALSEVSRVTLLFIEDDKNEVRIATFQFQSGRKRNVDGMPVSINTIEVDIQVSSRSEETKVKEAIDVITNQINSGEFKITINNQSIPVMTIELIGEPQGPASTSTGLSAGQIAGIIIGVLFCLIVVITVVFIIYIKRKRKRNPYILFNNSNIEMLRLIDNNE